MRFSAFALAFIMTLGFVSSAEAKHTPANSETPQQIEVTADQSLEWYQDQNIYVARGNAKAVRGDLTVNGDILTAHKIEKPKEKTPKDKQQQSSDQKSDAGGDIDRMTAEGHVVILKQNSRITGDKSVYDVAKHVIVVTGNNLRYETDKQVVTARDSLEYWDDKKIAVARGHAVAVREDRHVTGDVLTAEFRDQPDGSSQLYKMTGVGNVTVITKTDIARGDKGVYDATRDIAIITGHVRITRPDGTELAGDVGESDFKANQSRLLNSGSGRVRALLPAKATNSAKPTPAALSGGTP